jgi:hypothetical protein
LSFINLKHQKQIPPKLKTPEIDRKELTIELAEAISFFEVNALPGLLHDEGKFAITKRSGKSTSVNKTEFLSWMKKQMMKFRKNNPGITKLSYILDQSLYYKLGDPVIIFENGIFPVHQTQSFQKEKIGLSLEFEDKRISRITFCEFFVETENFYLFEK